MDHIKPGSLTLLFTLPSPRVVCDNVGGIESPCAIVRDIETKNSSTLRRGRRARHSQCCALYVHRFWCVLERTTNFANETQRLIQTSINCGTIPPKKSAGRTRRDRLRRPLTKRLLLHGLVARFFPQWNK
jgi:hypothetical protein